MWTNCRACGSPRKCDNIIISAGYEEDQFYNVTKVSEPYFQQGECSICGDPGFIEPIEDEDE